MTAPRPTAWAINRILALLFVLGPPEGAHDVLLLDRARLAYDKQARRARKHHADLPAFACTGAEPGRKRLAGSPPELALKHRLRKLPRHHRRRMRRVVNADRTKIEHIIGMRDWAHVGKTS